jgi:dipeptidyl aminopeptidase/acylaminoacyl peptidase
MDLQSRKIMPVTNASWDTDATEMSADGRLLAYTLNREGFSELYVRKLTDAGGGDDKDTLVALPGKGVAGGLDFSRDGRKLAFSFAGARFNSDVWLYDLKTRKLEQVTRASRAGIPQESFVEPELIRYKTFDGRDIPAWYYKPQNARAGDANRALPVIISVHGGPEGQERPAFNPTYQYFLARGYAVLAPNVRGSTGYGKAYMALDDVEKRMDSVADANAGAEWLVATGWADPRRIAAMGQSYGGFMVLACLCTAPDLWAAGVDVYGIANFVSFMENTHPSRRRHRAAEYGSLEQHRDVLERISPINQVDRIKAPVLAIHGEKDMRVPISETEQIVAALTSRGVPTELIRLPDEGHGLVKLPNRLRVYPAIADFLDRHIGT